MQITDTTNRTHADDLGPIREGLIVTIIDRVGVPESNHQAIRDSVKYLNYEGLEILAETANSGCVRFVDGRLIFGGEVDPARRCSVDSATYDTMD